LPSTKKCALALGCLAHAEAVDAELQFLNDFVTCIGRVRDMFNAMDTALKLKGTVSVPLQEFYDLRSHLTHGPQVAYAVDEDGLLKIPPIAGRNPRRGEWDDSSHWEDQDPTNFVYSAQFCLDTGTNFLKAVNRLHPVVYNGAERVFDGKRVDWGARRASAIPTSTGQGTSVSVFASGNVVPGSGDRGFLRFDGTSDL
jgi:hypothetical protein